MLPPSFGSKEPQRVCELCKNKLAPLQARLVETNANAHRSNEIEEVR